VPTTDRPSDHRAERSRPVPFVTVVTLVGAWADGPHRRPASPVGWMTALPYRA